MFSVEELKDRKIVQWALAYLAGAWVVLQLLDVVAEPWGIGAGLLLAAQILLGFGFLGTLVLAWYHGEKGRQRVSGPELLMLAALLVIAGAAVAVVRGDVEAGAEAADGDDVASPAETAAAATPDSISEWSVAVLPLDDHSPNPEDAYFADAMTEAITNALQKVPDLHVSARSSAQRFTESGMTVGEFARQKLGVAHAIEGSVQLQDDRVLVTVQLIDATTGRHVWSKPYEEALTDVVDVQVEIARDVADQLAATFTERAEERIRAGSTDDPEALDLYHQAIAVDVATPEDRDREIDLLRRAVARDSSFSLAYSELFEAYYQKRSATGDERFRDSMSVFIQRGLETAEEPSVKLRHQVYEIVYFEDDIEEAARLLRLYLRSSPSDHWATWSLSALYELEGELAEAVTWRRRALRLNPLETGTRLSLGRLYMQLGLDSLALHTVEEGSWSGEATEGYFWWRFDYHRIRNELDAAMAYVDSLRSNGDPYAAVAAGAVHLGRGDVERARESFDDLDTALLASHGWREAPLVAHVMLLTADTARAEELLRQAAEVPTAPRDVYSGAQLEMKSAAVRGDAEEAAAALRRSTTLGDRAARWIRGSSIYSRVIDDPEFQAALAEQEELIARERREVERMLAEEDR